MAPNGQTTSATDDQLVRRTAGSDPRALAELYDRHSPTALALARTILGPARAEDAVQDAFTSIWRGASSFDPARGLARAWLLSVVRNRSLDILRAGVSDARRADAARHERPPPDSDPALSAAVREDEAIAVHAAVRTLPADQRIVVELAFYRGMTQAEIAEALCIPLGTVKSRVRLALARLRKELGPVSPSAA